MGSPVAGEKVAPEEVEACLLPFARAVSEEKGGARCWVRAAPYGCAVLAQDGSYAMRRNLRAALRYWFSRVGTKDRPPDFALPGGPRRGWTTGADGALPCLVRNY